MIALALIIYFGFPAWMIALAVFAMCSKTLAFMVLFNEFNITRREIRELGTRLSRMNIICDGLMEWAESVSYEPVKEPEATIQRPQTQTQEEPEDA